MKPNVRINPDRLRDTIHEIAKIGPGIAGGSNRQTLTDDDGKGRDLFKSWCDAAGLSMGVDQMGTMFARREGVEPDLDPVYVGSHLDTQPTGGRYDGVLGVLSGLELVRTLNDLGIKTRRSAMASIQLTSIQKSFGGIEVLHGISVDIADGEFVVLVGPSGCGKSTLLRVIAGLESITGGEVRIDGRVVNDLEPKDRDIAMVFQNYALYPQMTVAQNLGFALEMAKIGRKTIEQKVQAVGATLGLEPLLQRYPRQLSGGQRQRVAMGRAIVRDPKVFLFDEPLSNLDAKLRVHMRGEIKGLQQRLRTTTVYVTHDQVEAMTMADKIVVLNAGRVEQIGPPLELYDRPASVFVAGFLGSPTMNFISGTVRTEQGAPFLELGDGQRLPLGSVPAQVVGRAVIYGVRPENLVVEPARGLSMVVTLVEPTGSDTHVVGKIGEADIVAVTRGRVSLTPNQHVFLMVDGSAGHFFDPATLGRLG